MLSPVRKAKCHRCKSRALSVRVAGEPNIIGKQITVNSAYGGLGVNSDAVTGELRTQGGEINTEILKLLAQADVDDVDWNADGTVTVELKQPVTVKADKFQAETETNVFVQSTADTALKISRVIARNGAVRLASANGVYGVSSRPARSRPIRRSTIFC